MRQPEDRYHDSKTGEFVTDEQGKSDPAGTVLVDHEKPLTPWMEEWIRLGEACEFYLKGDYDGDRNLDDDLNDIAVQAVTHVQQLKRP